MFDKLGSSLDANAQALRLRADRQKALAANIANADTPNYKAVDFDFGKALAAATGRGDNRPTPVGPGAQLAGTGPVHLPTLALARAGVDSATPTASTATILAATGRLARTDAGHLAGTLSTAAPDAPAMKYRSVTQPSIDGNTVDSDVEQARFADNTLRYEASLRFLNGQIKTLTSAISGQQS